MSRDADRIGYTTVAMRDCSPRAFADALDVAGWIVTEPLLSPARVDLVCDELSSLAVGGTRRGGVRNLLDVAGIRELARYPAVRTVAEAVLGSGCGAVRGLLFDKTPAANWRVAWHQDLTIAVRERRDVPGYGPWSTKTGVPHVQAPAAVLERMLAVRVHLDDCGPDNGPLRVLPGSHRSGRLTTDEIAAWTARADAVECTVARAGILAFRPLLVHASSPARSPAHRRVIHLEFAAAALGDGLQWHTWV